jgi:hypothetical protein
MDLYKTIRELMDEREKIDLVIAQLETVYRKEPVRETAAPGTGPRRRGRKGMSDAERMQVSQRMRNYWEKKRQNGEAPPVPERRAASA